MKNPVVNLTPLDICDMYQMSPAGSTDSCDDNSNSDPKILRRQLLQVSDCTICGMKFVSPGNARRHEKNVHNFYGNKLQPNPLNPEIMMNHAKAKSVMEPEILMEVDNENIYQSIGDNTDDDRSETLSMDFSMVNYEGDLTEDNLTYIQKYKNVIESVQEKRCFCCNRPYSRMKLLLAHLRKRTDIPPYQCFNCLISCENRSDYVQHMKMGQCRNVYALYKQKVALGEINPVENIENDYAELSQEQIAPKADKVPLKYALMYRVFSCNFCDFSNRIKAVTKKHLNATHLTDKNPLENPVQCQYCQKIFEDSESRRRHTQNCDCTTHVICELCGEKFDSLQPFNEHATLVHANNTNDRKANESVDSTTGQKVAQKFTKCKFCPKVYSTYHNMVRHVSKHHNSNNPYKCENCNETFSSQTKLTDHYTSCLTSQAAGEELQYNFSCKDCGVLFATLEGWTKHQEIHQACQQCGQTFQNQQELDLHKKEHLKVKYYSCNICGNSYSQAKQLSDHMVEHGVSENDVEHVCDICQETFRGVQEYAAHMEMHEGKIPMFDGFSDTNVTQSVLTEKSANSKEKNYFRCNVCNKHVETKQGLQKHMLFRHKKPLPDMSKHIYRCDLCPKRYMNARGVIRHKRTSHPNARQSHVVIKEKREEEVVPENDRISESDKFCSQCGLSGFRTQNDLNKHRLTAHFSKHARVCSICNFIAKDAKKMWYHKKKYHAIPGSSNQCNVCRKLFVTKPQLFAHIKTMHLNLPMEIEVTAATVPKVVYKSPPPPLPPLHELSDKHSEQEGPWNCDLCPKQFNTVNALKSHRGWHLRTPDGKSPGSGKSTNAWTPNQLSPSRQVVKKIKYPVAGASQDNNKFFMSKFKVVPKLPTGAHCKICNKTFSKIAVYKRHVMEYHRTKSKSREVEISQQDYECIQRLACNQCNETFQLKSEWIEHKVHHINNFVKEQKLRQWPCICGKFFGRKDNLKSHMRTHMHGVVENPEQSTGNAANVISNNAVSYNTVQNATQAGAQIVSPHMNIPNLVPVMKPVKPPAPANKFYTCNPCRVSFKTEKELKAHVDSHNLNGHGVAPRIWKCDFCGFMTEDIKLYQECRRAHHVPTKFKCEGCQIFFSSYNILVKHHEDSHKNDDLELPNVSNSFECNQCGKSYSMKHHLKRHIESAH